MSLQTWMKIWQLRWIIKRTDVERVQLEIEKTTIYVYQSSPRKWSNGACKVFLIKVDS